MSDIFGIISVKYWKLDWKGIWNEFLDSTSKIKSLPTYYIFFEGGA